MEIELIQNYINSVLQANNILSNVTVYSNQENIIFMFLFIKIIRYSVLASFLFFQQKIKIVKKK